MADLAAVEEVPVWLEVNGRPAVTWMCTPDLLEELAIGWLHGEGYIDSIDQVHLRPCATDLGFWAEVSAERVAAVQAEGRKPVLASGCGAVSTFLADPATVAPQPARGSVPELEQLRALFKALFARGERYKDTGGIHAAALVDSTASTLLAHAEDIGRHNAVDKVLGAALLSRRQFRDWVCWSRGGSQPSSRSRPLEPAWRTSQLHRCRQRWPSRLPAAAAWCWSAGPSVGTRSITARWSRVPPDEPALAELIRTARTIAVVGLSRKPERPSHGVAAYLQRAGYRIVPVHPVGGITLGEPVYPDLRTAAAARGPIDIVNIFRRSEHIAALLDAMLDVHPRLVWMQQGIRDDEVARRLESAGIPVVMDRCLAVDHQFLRT